VVRKLGRIPTAQLYDKNGKFSLGPFYTRYERWGRVMEAFKKFARAEKIETKGKTYCGGLRNWKKRWCVPRAAARMGDGVR
jgi:hypothetical protein